MNDKDNELKSYIPPSYFDDDGNKKSGKNFEEYELGLMNWICGRLSAGMSSLRSSRAWTHAESNMANLYGDDSKIPRLGLSEVEIKKLRRQQREAIANAFNIKPMFQISSSDEEKAEIYKKLQKAWWINQNLDNAIKESGQWAGGSGTGYLFLWPERDCLTGEWDIVPYPLSYKQVTATGWVTEKSRTQDVHELSVRLELPISKAHDMFPNHIDLIQVDRKVPSWIAPIFGKLRNTYKNVFSWKKNNNQDDIRVTFPTVDIFFTYVNDYSFNNTGKSVVVGELFNDTMIYTVPSLHDEEGNLNKVSNGLGGERYANINDCKYFPNRRLIISCSGGILYDGPPLFFNRYIPVVDFHFEKLPKEYLGFPLGFDSRKLESSVNNIVRSWEDSVLGKLNPPIGIDSKISAKDAAKFNPRRAIGQKFRWSKQLIKDAFTLLVDPKYYEIDGKSFEVTKYLQEVQDYQVGTNDFTNQARLKQMPAADTQEAFIQAFGTLATDNDRNIQQSLVLLGKIWLDYAPQIYTLSKRVALIGKDGICLESFDYDADTLMEKDYDSKLPKWKVLLKHLTQFNMFAIPSSMQEKLSYTNRMMLLNLQKLGVPIPSKKIYDTFVDDGGFDKGFKEWEEEQLRKSEIGARIQAKLQEIQAMADPNNLVIKKMAEDILAGHNLAMGNPEGRPNNFSAPPRPEIKNNSDGTQRLVNATN